MNRTQCSAHVQAVVLNEAFPDGQQEAAVFSLVTVPGKHLQT
ncbi:hypothetical protein Nmel_012133, partial [Mimus melanotis]